jgi:hypothetical protein
MSMKLQTYADVRDALRPGDVVAFGGDNPLSTAIMTAGKSVVSHAGIIVAAATEADEVQFLEATVRVEGNAPTAVAKTTDFPDRITEYHGRVWWLPLSAGERAAFRDDEFADYVRSVQGKPFDIAEGAAVVAKDALHVPNLPITIRTGDALFCSELVVDGLRRGGVVDKVNASSVSPAELCRWRIYGSEYSLLKGSPADAEIDGYNSREPGSD